MRQYQDQIESIALLVHHASEHGILWGALDLRHVFRSKKVLVFNAMEDITNDEYLARS